MTAPLVASRRVRPAGFERAVMRLSLAVLLWARRRADRSAISPEEHALLRLAQSDLRRDEHAAALLIARVHRAA